MLVVMPIHKLEVVCNERGGELRRTFDMVKA